MSSQPHAENRWNQIDRYVNGEMVEKERDLFEQRMREHAELAQQVHLHRDMLLGMEYYFMQQLKEQLALSDQKKKPFNWPLFLKIAAAVVLAVGLAGVAYYYGQRAANPEQLFLTYFEAYPNTLIQTNRSEASPGETSPGDTSLSDDASSEIAAAMREYERGSFLPAVAALSEALSLMDITDDRRTALVFYRGVANLKLGNARQARSDLTKVIQSDTLLTEPATWYTGLSYLQDKNVAEAKRIFEQLRAAQGDYAEQAAKLLDDLS
jgi:tetratricopeptide (TPR) repeat protein